LPAATHDPLFDSAWLKWAWAILHAQTLERDIAAWSEQNPNPVRAVRADYYPKRHGFALIITEIDPIPVRWQLMLGDIANNYRAAFDHLAWALVTRGRTPPESGLLTSKQEKAVYFPLCEDRRVFNAQIRVPPTPKTLLKLPGIRRADAAIVRRAQPYHRGPTKRPMDPFLLLASINTRDKHRAIHPVWAYPKRVDIEVTHMRNCVTRGTQVWSRRGNTLDVGAEVALIPARRLGPDPELEVKVSAPASPIIDNRVGVREWHAKTGIGLFKLLCQFSLQPASIHELGAEWAELPPV
jgi:hypothetical protein